MRLFLMLCWLTIPLLAWAYHIGPGQQQMEVDDAHRQVILAQELESQEDDASAVKAYSDALSQLDMSDQSEQIRVRKFETRLAMAKAQMRSNQLPEARFALQALLDELEDRDDIATKLIDDTRQSLASAQYYMTWLMRLEGLPELQWEPEIEASRQHFRVLAEKVDSSDQQVFTERRRDLESAIQLARMDLADLQALKIPSQCQSCCSGQCDKPSRKQSKKNEKKKAGANLGPLPDGSGS
ncbi:MAG: hypothetical protein AAF670_06235 [Planctomycetota bacterium]